MRKSPAIRRMVKAGRQARGMPPGRTGRIARPPQPKPAPSTASPFAEMPEVTEAQADAAQERPYNDLYDKKVVDLRAMAKDAGIKGFSKMNKNQLVEALS